MANSALWTDFNEFVNLMASVKLLFSSMWSLAVMAVRSSAQSNCRIRTRRSPEVTADGVRDFVAAHTANKKRSRRL